VRLAGCDGSSSWKCGCVPLLHCRCKSCAEMPWDGTRWQMPGSSTHMHARSHMRAHHAHTHMPLLAAVTTPFDVVKTRLQTEGVHSAKRYKGSAVVSALS